ncbi:hypothetical protein AVEN_180155-1 [Araneus ventricosus]|uniref:Uncharacterized protein n=1 Tax=Araneus ventricosus TaxID=182803 RepID=A0A4Y2D5Q1_ARAVE|nr:hypothetical protein AVEN_180155-1 [Araneus ventricosus]
MDMGPSAMDRVTSQHHFYFIPGRNGYRHTKSGRLSSPELRGPERLPMSLFLQPLQLPHQLDGHGTIGDGQGNQPTAPLFYSREEREPAYLVGPLIISRVEGPSPLTRGIYTITTSTKKARIIRLILIHVLVVSPLENGFYIITSERKLRPA